jgi:hypothetical protein
MLRLNPQGQIAHPSILLMHNPLKAKNCGIANNFPNAIFLQDLQPEQVGNPLNPSADRGLRKAKALRGCTALL